MFTVKLIKEALETLQKWLGLIANPAKSSFYLSCARNDTRKKLRDILNFKEGKLPFKYLGVPMVYSKILLEDSKLLIDRILTRIKSWRCNYLSYAGRLVLIKSILFSLQIFWSSHLFLPSLTLKEIDAKIRDFF